MFYAHIRADAQERFELSFNHTVANTCKALESVNNDLDENSLINLEQLNERMQQHIEQLNFDDNDPNSTCLSSKHSLKRQTTAQRCRYSNLLVLMTVWLKESHQTIELTAEQIEVTVDYRHELAEITELDFQEAVRSW